MRNYNTKNIVCWMVCYWHRKEEHLYAPFVGRFSFFNVYRIYVYIMLFDQYQHHHYIIIRNIVCVFDDSTYFVNYSKIWGDIST